MPLKVYYLDDESDLCENFFDQFSTPDVAITTFCDPQAALTAIESSPPDLFFIDYRLPGTTGDALAQQMDPKIPKFLITGDLSIQTVYAFKKIFSKPYDPAEITKIFEDYQKK